MKLILALMVALAVACGGPDPTTTPEPTPPTPIAGDWLCAMPGHLDDPYAFQAGWAAHISLSAAHEVQASGTYEGSWETSGIGSWGYLRGDWDGTSISMQERSTVSGLPSGSIRSGSYTPGARTFTLSLPVPGVFIGLGSYSDTGTMVVTCRKYAGQ